MAKNVIGVSDLEELDDRHEVEEPEWRQVLPPFPTVEDGVDLDCFVHRRQ